jgi:hypothetical protein
MTASFQILSSTSSTNHCTINFIELCSYIILILGWDYIGLKINRKEATAIHIISTLTSVVTIGLYMYWQQNRVHLSLMSCVISVE